MLLMLALVCSWVCDMEQKCHCCGWVGNDLESYHDDKEDADVILCSPCAYVLQLTMMGIKKVKDMQPTQLIPLIRECVAQVSGTMLTMVVEGIQSYITQSFMLFEPERAEEIQAAFEKVAEEQKKKAN